MGLFSIFLAARTFEGEFSNVTRVVPAKTVRYACQRVLGLHLAMGSLHYSSLLFAAPWPKIAPHKIITRCRPNLTEIQHDLSSELARGS